MSILTINFNLTKNGEPGIEVFSHKLLDISLTLAFLVEELIAGEGQDL
jgi:hypothetical protein